MNTSKNGATAIIDTKDVDRIRKGICYPIVSGELLLLLALIGQNFAPVLIRNLG
jgi:hypothetical protein